MAGYTVVNLREIEDQAPRFGFAPNMEARYARGPLGLDQAGVSLFRLAPDYRQPFGHRHTQQEEVYVIIAGSARIKVDDEVVELRQWDAIRVPGDTTRALQGGPEGAELIAFGAPSADNRDAEMVPNWWTD